MAIALLAVAVFFISQAALLDFGHVGLPGPGFFPFALGVALCLVSLMILFVMVRSPDEGERVYVGHRDVLVVIAALGGVAFAFEQADTYLVLGTFLASVLLLVARTTLWRALLGACLGMVLVWVVFRFALGVRLPAGRFWSELAAWLPSVFPTGLS
ncbi:MAG: tripartite tricarboxylate transporter TctB family protein [Sphingomonadales bacterium]|nr:tripartite tricarboxylate transporter TctB family protein [Sphingomonadales bacterium]